MIDGEKHMKNWQISSIRNHKSFWLILVFILLVLIALSMCLGAISIPWHDLWNVVFRGERGTTYANILLLVRLPRTLGCVAAGSALAVSGAVIQGVLQNPLAAPHIIGVNSGAGLMVVAAMAIVPSALYLVPLFAFAGALAGVMIVLLMAEKTGAGKITIVLAGVAISSMFGAGIDAIVTFVPDSLTGYTDFRIGGLNGLSMARVLPAACVIVAALVVILFLTREMDLLLLGEETAHSLGLNVKAVRFVLLMMAAALAGAAVSFAGLLGFIGLIIPHIMRRIVGEGSLKLVSASALGGAVFLTLCDLLARLLFAPFEIPVGIILSLIGGPFFIWLLFMQRRRRSHD